jgi:protein kinase N
LESNTSSAPRTDVVALELSGRLVVGILRAGRLLVDGGADLQVRVRVGSTAAWHTFSDWCEEFQLDFVKQRECELQVVSSKATLVGTKFVQLEDFLDGNQCHIRMPLEPEGALDVTFRYERGSSAPPPQESSLMRPPLPSSPSSLPPSAAGMESNQQRGPRALRPQRSTGSIRSNNSIASPAFPLQVTLQAPALKVNAQPAERASVATLNLAPVAAGMRINVRAFSAKVVPSSKLSMADFNLLAVLGRGHFGKVLLAEKRLTKHVAAIKCLKKTEVISRDALNSLRTERTILKLISAHQHPFLVHIFAAFQTATHICFVLEFVSGGDLHSHVERAVLTEERCMFFAACVTLGLEFLHGW